MTAATVQLLIDLEELRDQQIGAVFTGLHPARILLHKSNDESLSTEARKLLVEAAGHAQTIKGLYEWWSVPEPEDTL